MRNFIAMMDSTVKSTGKCCWENENVENIEELTDFGRSFGFYVFSLHLFVSSFLRLAFPLFVRSFRQCAAWNTS